MIPDPLKDDSMTADEDVSWHTSELRKSYFIMSYGKIK